MNGDSREFLNSVKEKIGFLQGDLRSYIYLRLDPTFSTSGLGGGNITAAIGSFALLNLLAKVHRAVTKPEKFVLASDPLLRKPWGSCCRAVPRLHDVNESDSFSAFVAWLGREERINLGIGSGDASGIWNEYRNWLVHRFDTRHMVLTYLYIGTGVRLQTTAEADDLLRRQVTEKRAIPFSKEAGGRWTFNVDIFYMLLDDMAAAMERLLLSAELSADSREILNNIVLGREQGSVDTSSA